MTVLLVGDDWAADHHDVELMDQAGRVLARARLPEGAAGMARLHALVGEPAIEQVLDKAIANAAKVAKTCVDATTDEIASELWEALKSEG